jgi:hypothetical protein
MSLPFAMSVHLLILKPTFTNVGTREYY